MAVEARHMNLLPTELLGNRQMVNPVEANTNLYNNHMVYALPLSGTTTAETFLPVYNSAITDLSLLPKTAIKSDNGVTCNVTNSSRKRSRDSFNPFIENAPQNNSNFDMSFLGEDLSNCVQHQQNDLYCLISKHMAKVRIEMEESRKKQARKIIQAIEIGVMKSLKAKEEELNQFEKLNYALEERVKSLCMESQMWKDLAKTNEVKANALRTNIQQVMMAQAREKVAAAANIDDVVSSCGSNGNEGDQEEANGSANQLEYKNSSLCRNCWMEESCVFLLPCRHLCLCTLCGSNLHVCPVCNSVKNASVHVNFS